MTRDPRNYRKRKEAIEANASGIYSQHIRPYTQGHFNSVQLAIIDQSLKCRALHSKRTMTVGN